MTHLSSHASDHLPIVLSVQSSRKSGYKGQKSFKFEEAWLLFDDCEEVIKDAWERSGAEATGLGVVKQKVAACALDLQAWGSSKVQPEAKEIKRLQKQIEQLNSADLTEEIRAEYLVTSRNLDAFLRKQEIN